MLASSEYRINITSEPMASGVEIARSVSTGDLGKMIDRLVCGSPNQEVAPKFSPKNLRTSRGSSSGSRTPHQKNSPRRKFKWHDPDTGYTLTAGGILFYDDQGVWVIGEKDKNGIVYTDMGGRYAYEDGHIWAAIARELREETYGLCEMFVSEIVSLSKRYPPVYVNGHDGKPVYVCLVIPISALELPRVHFVLDPALFDVQRRKTLAENPEVPSEYYSPCVLTRLTYEELKNPSFRLSYRLKRVIKFSPIFSSVFARSEPNSPYDTDEDE